MRCSAILALVAAVSSVSAAELGRRQSITDYPPCALTCLATANFGTCSETDFSCLCKSQAFIDGTTKCITSSCTGDDLTKAEGLAQSACASAGVTLSAPAATGTAPSSGSASASAAAPSQTSNAAPARGASAFVALAAVGAAALAL